MRSKCWSSAAGSRSAKFTNPGSVVLCDQSRARGFPMAVAGAAVGAPSCGQGLTTCVVFGRVVFGAGEDVAEVKGGLSVIVAAFDLVGGQRLVPRARGSPFVVAGAAANAPACGQELTAFVVFGWVVAEA